MSVQAAVRYGLRPCGPCRKEAVAAMEGQTALAANTVKVAAHTELMTDRAFRSGGAGRP